MIKKNSKQKTDINKRFDKIDKKFDEVLDGIKMVIEITGEHNEKFKIVNERFDKLEEKLDKNLEEINSILDDHERQLDKIEDKVYSQSSSL